VPRSHGPVKLVEKVAMKGRHSLPLLTLPQVVIMAEMVQLAHVIMAAGVVEEGILKVVPVVKQIMAAEPEATVPLLLQLVLEAIIMIPLLLTLNQVVGLHLFHGVDYYF
jgi:hypothetical protein